MSRISSNPLVIENLNVNPVNDSTFNLGCREKNWNSIHINSIENDNNLMIKVNEGQNSQKKMVLLSGGINKDSILLTSPIGGITINSKIINLEGNLDIKSTKCNIELKENLNIINNGSFYLDCNENISLISTGLANSQTNILLKNTNGIIDIKSGSTNQKSINLESTKGGIKIDGSQINLLSKKNIYLESSNKNSIISIGTNNIENTIIIGNDKSIIKLKGEIEGFTGNKYSNSYKNLINLANDEYQHEQYGIYANNNCASFYDNNLNTFIFTDKFELDENSNISSTNYAKILVSDININNKIRFDENGDFNINDTFKYNGTEKKYIFKDSEVLLKGYGINYINLSKIYQFYVGKDYNFNSLNDAIQIASKYSIDKIINIYIMDSLDYKEDIFLNRNNINIIGSRNYPRITGKIKICNNNKNGTILFENMYINSLVIEDDNSDIHFKNINFADKKKLSEYYLFIKSNRLILEKCNFNIENTYSSMINLEIIEEIKIEQCQILYNNEINYNDILIDNSKNKNNPIIDINNNKFYGCLKLKCKKLNFYQNYLQTKNNTFIYLENKDISYFNDNKFIVLDKNNNVIKWIDYINQDNIPNIMESNNIFNNKNIVTNESIYSNTVSQNSLSISNSLFLGYEKITIYDDITDISSEKCVTEINCINDMKSEGELENGINNGQLKILINNIIKGELKITYNSNKVLILNNSDKKTYKLIWNNNNWLLI